MADGDAPNRPKPPAGGKPLPRLWKAEPEAETPEESVRKSRKERLAEEKARDAEPDERPGKRPKASAGESKSAKGQGKARSAETKARPKGKVLIEDTPEMDTYETRQRARLLIGGLVAAIALVGVYFLFQSFRGPEFSETDLVDEGKFGGGGAGVGGGNTPTAAPVVDRSADEAANLFGTARLLAKNGKADQAVGVLEKIAKTYPKTPSAKKAREALDRPKANLPLFDDDGKTLVADPAVRPPAAKPDGPPVMVVDGSNPVVAPGAPGNAQIGLQPNTPEPARTGPTGTAATANVAARPLPPGFTARDETGVHASGWPNQILSDRDGATMVLIPGGEFLQGRDDGEPDERPEHRVVLSPFYIDQHEVTIRQLAIHLKETGKKPPPRPASSSTSAGKAKKPDPADAPSDDEAPAVNLTFRDAESYCEWAGKRLPTEAQWEAAARTTDGRPFPWGANEPIWARPRATRQIDPVMSYDLDMSPYGVFDLGGNAWEWTTNWFDAKYYLTLKGQTVTDPLGPRQSPNRPPLVVVKGGSKTWNASWREGVKADTRFPYLGFRGSLSISGDTIQAPTAGATPNAPPTTGTNRPPAADGVVPF